MKKILRIGFSVFILSLASNTLWSQIVNIESNVSSLAGSATNIQGATEGTGTSASFRYPTAVATDAAGNIYVADSENNKIRKITPLGVTSTLAGSGTPAYADGTGTGASFYNPTGLVVDVDGNVYVADAVNNRIRKITSTGVVTTFAGSGTAGMVNGTGTNAQFNSPRGITMDVSGNIFVADQGNYSIRKITPAGEVSTLAGKGSYGYLDATGTLAEFGSPMALVSDLTGNIYVADWDNHRIRKITPVGVVTTLAGNSAEGSLDGIGTAATFGNPAGLAIDASGDLYVGDYGQHRIRKITSAGVVTTLVGSIEGYTDGASSTALLARPRGLAFDLNNNLYIADFYNHKIRKYKTASLDAISIAYQQLPFVEQTFSISGTGLTANLVVTAPAGYTLSNNSIQGTSLTFTPVSGTVAAKTITISLNSFSNNVGNYNGNVTVSSAGATAKSLPVNGTITKANQTINTTYLPDPLPNKNVGDAPFEMYASASSNLEVTYASSNPAVATVSGNILTVVGSGTCNITISQAGNTNFNAASNVVVPFTVNKISQSITFNNLPTKTVVDASFALTATASSGLPVSYSSTNTSVATIVGNTVTIVGIGSTTITASQAGNASYNAAVSQMQAFEVTIAPQTISFTLPAAISLATGSLTLNGSASSSLTVSYTSSNASVATVSGNTLTFTGSGYTIITASQAGNANYSPANDVQFSLEVNSKQSQSITFDALPTKTTIDAPFALSASSSAGLTITYASSNTLVATVSGNTITIVGPGTTSITASQIGDLDYNPAFDVVQSLVVTTATEVKTIQSFVSKVYPNPSIGTLNIELQNGLEEAISYSIIDMQGITLYTAQLNGAIGNYQLDIASLTAGVYQLKLTNKHTTSSYQFVKQ